MNKKKITLISGMCVISSIALLAVLLPKNGAEAKEIAASEKTLVEDFSDPQFNAGVLHTEDAVAYIDLECSSAALNGASLVMANASTAEAEVKGVTKVQVTFSGDLSVSIATNADKYYVTESLTSATIYEFPYVANFIKFTAAAETTISRIEYSYLCEAGETYLTNLKTTSLTLSSDAQGTDQCYNYWLANSGVKESISNNSTNLSFSFAVKADKTIYGNDALGYGTHKEIFFQTWFYVYDTSTSSNAGSFYLNVFKYDSVYVVRLLQGSTQLINYRQGALHQQIFEDIPTEHGARFVLDFTGGSVQLFYNNNGTYTSLGTSASNLSYFNGNNGGTQQIRYCDFKSRANASDSNKLTSTLSDFQVAYGYHRGTGKLVKA